MIQIGFLEKTTDCNLKNKVGGHPSYLGKNLSRMYCVVCETEMMFLMQLFTPEETEIQLEEGLMGKQEIDRMIHVFACPKNHEIAVFRSQMPANNSPDQTILSTKICQGKVWSEWEIVSEDFEETELQTSMENYCLESNQKIDSVIETEEDDMLANEKETTVEVDDAFLKYQSEIALEPDQVLRYYRIDYSGQDVEPLWVSDKGKCTDPPLCPYCGGNRTLEFQITSQILNFLDIDHSDKDALDFGTLIIYSCQNSCDSKKDFMAEFCWRQEFTCDGIKLPFKNPNDVIR